MRDELSNKILLNKYENKINECNFFDLAANGVVALLNIVSFKKELDAL